MVNIEFSGVTKIYKNSFVGLNNISLNIESGVFGLLGHNGAGKTTLMKCLATILRPTEGTIKVFGYDTTTHGNLIRHEIGYLPQELNMYPNLTVEEFVTYIARVKGTKSKSFIFDALENVDMLDKKNSKIKELSGGMKRRVGIAQAILGSPKLLIVDEPTAGLDPEERVRFRGILSKYAQNNKTVLLSTHIVEDIYKVCEKVSVLREGSLFFTGDSSNLMSCVHDKIKVLSINNEFELLELQKKCTIISTTYEKEHINVRVFDDKNNINASIVEETLEDAYLYCMGGKIHV